MLHAPDLLRAPPLASSFGRARMMQ